MVDDKTRRGYVACTYEPHGGFSIWTIGSFDRKLLLTFIRKYNTVTRDVLHRKWQGTFNKDEGLPLWFPSELRLYKEIVTEQLFVTFETPVISTEKEMNEWLDKRLTYGSYYDW